MTTGKEKGRLYLVGVGPGNPEMMTCQAVDVLEKTKVWLAPKARTSGTSSAVMIAGGKVDFKEKTVLELRFPMKRIYLDQKQDPEVIREWKKAAETVRSYLNKGSDVAFPTLGDPALYSTAFYLLAVLQELEPEVKVSIIPGITAMSGCSAEVLQPIGLGDDVVSIVPAAFEDDRLREIFENSDVIVIMKVFHSMKRIVAMLDEFGLCENAVLIEKCGMDDQKIHTDIRAAVGLELHYFSTMLVRRKNIR
jgi:precorrin-2/cobalt-factor-2 C20-methyltransferase